MIKRTFQPKYEILQCNDVRIIKRNAKLKLSGEAVKDLEGV